MRFVKEIHNTESTRRVFAERAAAAMVLGTELQTITCKLECENVHLIVKGWTNLIMLAKRLASLILQLKKTSSAPCSSACNIILRFGTCARCLLSARVDLRPCFAQEKGWIGLSSSHIHQPPVFISQHEGARCHVVRVFVLATLLYKRREESAMRHDIPRVFCSRCHPLLNQRGAQAS